MKFTMYTGFSKKVLEYGIEYAAEYALQMGFSSVEFLANSCREDNNAIIDVTTARHAKEVLDQYNLSVACYSVFSDLWKNSGEEKVLMKQVEIATALGSPYFHHTLIPWLTVPKSAPSYWEAIEKVVDSAARIADYGNTFGITCIYEDQGCYVNGVSGFQGFWNQMQMRCKNIGICGDLGNILFVNELPQDFLRTYIKDICHVHVKDYLWKKAEVSPGSYWVEAKDNSWLRDTMVGNGVIDFGTCMNILKNAGYQGYFSLENTHPEPYEEGVQQAMEYLKRFW